jgi:hypothetical protein
MIFEHYRKWMNNLTRRDRSQIAGLYAGSTPKLGHPQWGPKLPAGRILGRIS